MTTIVGTGEQADNNEILSGPANLTRINNPNGISIDSTGALIFADTNTCMVVKAYKNNYLSVIAGNGDTSSQQSESVPSLSQALAYPMGTWVNDAGVVFVSLSEGNNVRANYPSGREYMSVNYAGVPETAGTFPDGNGIPATSANMKNPGHIFGDSVGNLYIADFGNNVVYVVTAEFGVIHKVAGNGDSDTTGDGEFATDASLNNPIGVFVNVAGEVFITEYLGNCIRKADTSNLISTIAGEFCN